MRVFYGIFKKLFMTFKGLFQTTFNIQTKAFPVDRQNVLENFVKICMSKNVGTLRVKDGIRARDAAQRNTSRIFGIIANVRRRPRALETTFSFSKILRYRTKSRTVVLDLGEFNPLVVKGVDSRGEANEAYGIFSTVTAT